MGLPIASFPSALLSWDLRQFIASALRLDQIFLRLRNDRVMRVHSVLGLRVRLECVIRSDIKRSDLLAGRSHTTRDKPCRHLGPIGNLDVNLTHRQALANVLILHRLL